MSPRDVRHRLGLTQAELAFVLGVHPQTVSDWERGKGNPTSWLGLPPFVERLWPAFEAWNGGSLRRTLRRDGALVVLATVLAAYVELVRLSRDLADQVADLEEAPGSVPLTQGRIIRPRANSDL